MAVDPNAPELPKTRMQSTFSTGRQIFIFSFYIFYLAANIAFLGMVSDQLHKYGNVWTHYPDGRWYHSLGLGLFIGIFFTMVGLAHAFLNHPILMFCHFAGATMSGIVAGLFTATPFGHGRQCSNPVDSFPAKYQPFIGECRKITAITALAWTMFGLNTLALFYLAADGFNCVRNHTSIYAPWEPPAKIKDEESETEHHH